MRLGRGPCYPLPASWNWREPLCSEEGSSPIAVDCYICGQHPGIGMKVSFSHKRSPRRWNPNIQRIRIMKVRTPRRRNVCTSCIKANKVRRAV